jgi:hypothetical protein
MNVRIDSPFAKLTEAQCENLLDASETMAVDELVEQFKGAYKVKCSVPAMRRFLRRLREKELIKEGKEAEGNVAALAKAGEDPKVREATLTTARQRMFETMLETNNREALLEMFTALNEEKAKEREWELEERKVRVAEENAKLGWKKLEHDRAISAAKLLPKVWLILSDVKMDAQERVVRAQECLAREGARLLPEVAVGTVTRATALGELTAGEIGGGGGERS